MAIPLYTTGSLSPTFVPAPPVGVTVKHPYAIALRARLPFVLRVPWEASVTLLEATTPVKLPTKQCPRFPRVRDQMRKGPYFNVDSARAGAPASLSPDYPTHHAPGPNAKLQ